MVPWMVDHTRADLLQHSPVWLLWFVIILLRWLCSLSLRSGNNRECLCLCLFLFFSQNKMKYVRLQYTEGFYPTFTFSWGRPRWSEVSGEGKPGGQSESIEETTRAGGPWEKNKNNKKKNGNSGILHFDGSIFLVLFPGHPEVVDLNKKVSADSDPDLCIFWAGQR